MNSSAWRNQPAPGSPLGTSRGRALRRMSAEDDVPCPCNGSDPATRLNRLLQGVRLNPHRPMTPRGHAGHGAREPVIGFADAPPRQQVFAQGRGRLQHHAPCALGLGFVQRLPQGYESRGDRYKLLMVSTNWPLSSNDVPGNPLSPQRIA